MKRLICLSLAAMMVLAVSCKKDNSAAAPKVPDGAVDLGIVMTREDGTTYRLYWAKSNLSANGLCANPEDYGDYYAWGETSPKDNYSWSTYKFGTNPSGPFSKYNTIGSYGTLDSKTVLEPEDDVAHVKLEGKWRMPTDKEWEELRTKCTSTGTSDYNGTGVGGRLITSPNGNSIFLPFAGFRLETSLNDAGSEGYYWSSALDTDRPYRAWQVYLSPGGVFSVTGNGRNYGFSVRPVWEE